MSKVIDHNHPEYIQRRKEIGKGKYNGCYYYSKEIVDNIIPRVKTDRDWNTVGRDVEGMHDGMIVFLHDNLSPWHYGWLQNYKGLILICSSQYVADSVKYWGKTILLPMSIDTEYVKQFRVAKKTRGTCFVGNEWVKNNIRSMTYPYAPTIPNNVDCLSGMRREKLLKCVAKYRRAYAIDRCAQEAKVLGCELLELDTRYGVDHIGEVLDNREAATILQKELDKLEGGNMKHERRTMKRGESYEIEEKIGNDLWVTVSKCATINEAKEVLKNLEKLDKESK